MAETSGHPPFNVTFDLGGVVLHWDPSPLIAQVFDDPGDREKVRCDILGHNDWQECDRGTLDRGELLRRASRRTGITPPRIQRFLDLIPPSLKPNDGTLAIMRRLKQQNHPLYCLSNMHPPSIAYLEKHCNFWHLFDGVVISCHVKLIKPEAAIYDHLLRKYELNAERTIFIDDLPRNLEGAAALGIHTIEFTTPQDCEKQLNERFGI